MRVNDWVARELPTRLQATWNDADGLYAIITKTIEAGATVEVDEATRRLEMIEGDTERQVVARALVHLGGERPGEAEQVLRRFARVHGETPIIAANVAKAMWAQGREREARVQLRHALALDPNGENALQWWASIHGSEGGDVAYQRALLDVSREPGAWLARVLLARQYAQHGRTVEAREILDRVATEFAHLEAARTAVERERARIETLASICHNDSPTLTDASRPHDEPVRMASVPLFAPIWTRGLDDANWIVDGGTKAAGSRICIFAFADSRLNHGTATLQAQAETSLGCLSRSLPLYLGETLMLRTDTRVAVIIPVVLNAGIFVSAEGYALDMMVRYCPPIFPPRVIISGTFLDRDLLRLEVWDLDRREHLLGEELSAGDPVALARRLEERVLHLLTDASITKARPRIHTEHLMPAPSELHEAYLHAEAHLLTQLLAASRVIPTKAIWNEAAMYQTYFGLCGLYPQLLAPRLLAMSGVLAGLACRSPEALSYVESARALLSEEGPHQDIIERIAPLFHHRVGDDAAARRIAERLMPADECAYRRWLTKIVGGF